MENDSPVNDVKTPTVHSLINTARAILEKISYRDLAEVKQLTRPPLLMTLVFCCVLALKPTGQENFRDGWRGAQVMLSDPNILSHLRNYTDIMQERCTPRMITRVNKILNHESDQARTDRYLVGEKGVNNVKDRNVASGHILEWVQTIVYLHILMKSELEPSSTDPVQRDSEEKNSEANALNS